MRSRTARKHVPHLRRTVFDPDCRIILCPPKFPACRVAKEVGYVDKSIASVRCLAFVSGVLYKVSDAHMVSALLLSSQSRDLVSPYVSFLSAVRVYDRVRGGRRECVRHAHEQGLYG